MSVDKVEYWRWTVDCIVDSVSTDMIGEEEKLEEEIGVDRKEKEKESVMVVGSYTVVDPGTMVIIDTDTLSTELTMFTPFRLHQFTVSTHFIQTMSQQQRDQLVRGLTSTSLQIPRVPTHTQQKQHHHYS